MSTVGDYGRTVNVKVKSAPFLKVRTAIRTLCSGPFIVIQ
jgi:hypothetical protein